LSWWSKFRFFFADVDRNSAFCLLLVLMNLLFLQWLYYKVHDFRVKQL
jgi:hypothetical protein